MGLRNGFVMKMLEIAMEMRQENKINIFSKKLGNISCTCLYSCVIIANVELKQKFIGDFYGKEIRLLI